MRLTIAAAAALALGACKAPADELWIRITSFQSTGETTETISTLQSNLRDKTTDYVDVNLENSAVLVNNTDAGVGITVYHARVEYVHQSYQLPSYNYAVTLYIPPVGGGGGDATTSTSARAGSTTATLENLPLVPATLKSWILQPENVPAEVANSSFQVQARVILRARTEELNELETESGLSVVFVPGID